MKYFIFGNGTMTLNSHLICLLTAEIEFVDAKVVEMLPSPPLLSEIFSKEIQSFFFLAFYYVILILKFFFLQILL